MESLRGQLLIASPALLDPNFHRTVVLVVEHGEEGSIGLVLNRPTQTEVADVASFLAELVEEGAPLLAGGPVETGAVLVLAELEDPAEAASVVLGHVGLIGAEEDVARLAGSVHRARVFAGYAGWGAGQLEAELEEEAWILEPAGPEDVFAEEPGELWASVLHRKGGQFRLLARMPPDPSVN